MYTNIDYVEHCLKFYTLDCLIAVCENYQDLNVVFKGVDATVGDLISWRGSYNLPAITPLYGVRKKGIDIVNQLSEQMEQYHTGWKGGEYKFETSDCITENSSRNPTFESFKW